MSDYIAKSVRQQIYEASKNRCEYCQTDQRITGGQMHIEHIIPTSRGGSSMFANLCLSCAWCNTFKSDKITGLDPTTGVEVPLFHPREDAW
ncbi:MAG: HNH endonuclease, partial [Chloroflexota bacterium]